MLTFAYQRSVAPMLWALMAVAVVEACVVHLLVALLWSKWVALALSAISLATITWLALLARSFGTLPVTLEGDAVTMRAGTLKAIRFARADVARVEGEVSASALKEPGMLKLSLLAHPNVVVQLRAPIALGRRRIERVAHRLDDPGAFARALTQ